MVRVGIEAALVEHCVDHAELAEWDPVARFELRAVARDGHDPFVVRRKEDGALAEPLRVIQQVLDESALVLERVGARVARGHGARRLAKAARIGIERDHVHAMRRERARDREAGDVAVENDGAG